ncbi:hypothetical protein M758_9G127500 [Ceratodon purpureus]|nr:hypothetical protein M758_9G127500 [Ceratodon purpureus]
MAMVALNSCEEADLITRPTSSRDNHRHTCARAHGRRSAAHQEAIVQERKQRSRTKTRKQRTRSKTRNRDRRHKWEELIHRSDSAAEEILGSLDGIIRSCKDPLDVIMLCRFLKVHTS